MWDFELYAHISGALYVHGQKREINIMVTIVLWNFMTQAQKHKLSIRY